MIQSARAWAPGWPAPRWRSAATSGRHHAARHRGARSAACLGREVPILPLDAVDGDVECAAHLRTAHGQPLRPGGAVGTSSTNTRSAARRASTLSGGTSRPASPTTCGMPPTPQVRPRGSRTASLPRARARTTRTVTVHRRCRHRHRPAAAPFRRRGRRTGQRPAGPGSVLSQHSHRSRYVRRSPSDNVSRPTYMQPRSGCSMSRGGVRLEQHVRSLAHLHSTDEQHPEAIVIGRAATVEFPMLDRAHRAVPTRTSPVIRPSTSLADGRAVGMEEGAAGEDVVFESQDRRTVRRAGQILEPSDRLEGGHQHRDDGDGGVGEGEEPVERPDRRGDQVQRLLVVDPQRPLRARPRRRGTGSMPSRVGPRSSVSGREPYPIHPDARVPGSGDGNERRA